MSYEAMAEELLGTIRPKHHRRPPTQIEQNERVKDGTLRFLFQHEGEASAAQLLDFFGFSSARLTKILTDLEQEGLVVRESHPDDRRRVNVRLTDAGIATALEKHRYTISEIARILELLGETDAKNFVRILIRLHKIREDKLNNE